MSEEEKTRCKECGSTQTYIRTSSVERVCRKCGHIEKIQNEIREVKNNGI